MWPQRWRTQETDDCDCPACLALSTALRIHADSVYHYRARREVVRLASIAVDQHHHLNARVAARAARR